MSIYATSEEIISGNTARLINLAKENNFSAVRLLAPFQVGQLAENNHTYTPEASIQLKIILSKYPHFIKTHGIWNCFVPHKTNVYISPFGDVQPCSMIPFAFGNIHRENLYAILKRMRNHALCNIEEPGCVMNSLYMKELMHKESAVTTQSLPIHIR